jgi:hypothetical protein
VNIIADIVFSEHMFNHVCYSIFFCEIPDVWANVHFFVCVSNIIIILYISNPVPFK